MAATWVLWLALAMWRIPAVREASRAATGRRIFTTTLLNPKAPVFGLVLLPAAETGRVLFNFTLFSTLIVTVAMAWAALGSALRGAERGGGLPRGWRWAASVWLGALAVYMIGRVAGLG